ncbi:hypothetical protein [Tissierella sp.]|uniref:hypothetical protein n=1 Tax=Tissierella sp. TaxID=41274 RepID=UPI0028607141|nr:hypothetical protein [Tissierella sp.]MDR7856080.1 hypothetical protein [Tissierella sp.]
MSKDYLAVNAGRVILTKVDPMTGALSTKPEDKRILTETCDGITRQKTMNTYEIPDGNSNYPAGVYETGVAYTIGINLTTLNSATLAFLQNAKISKAAGKVKEVITTAIPLEAPYEIELLGTVDGTPTVLDSESKPMTKAVAPDAPIAGEFDVEVGAADAPDKLVFASTDAGKEITIEYVFEADEVEAYDINENHINPTIQIEIIHETLAKDKTKRYKNNSTISRAQLTGSIDENLAKQHAPSTLNFAAIKPAGVNVVMNKKTEIPL